MMSNLKIDPEFQSKIPPLTAEEFGQLEANILEEKAVLMPLIVWNGFIVDGHNRFTILQKHPDLEFTIREKVFADRYEAIVWICKNQLGRRNLTPQQKKYLIGKQYEAEKTRRGAYGTFRGNQYTEVVNGQNVRLPKNERSNAVSERIAKENNTNEKYVRRAEKFAKDLDTAEESAPGIRQEVLSGALKPTAAEIAAVARAPPQERSALIEKLRTPREPPEPNVCLQPRKLTRKDMKLVREENEKMRNSDVRPTGKSMLCEVEGAKDSFISRWSGVFHHFPDLLTDAENLAFVHKAADELLVYLKDVKGVTL